MIDVFLRTLNVVGPSCRWSLRPRYTIGVKMQGKALIETYTMPFGPARRIWGDNGAIHHTPASLFATHMGYPTEGGMFHPKVGLKLGLYPWQSNRIMATSEGREDDPSYDPKLRAQILGVLGLQVR